MMASICGQSPNSVQRHVILVCPEVPWNTGNIGRTCLGVGAHLHLIQPLGFSLNSRELKRAGLDYWSRVSVSVWENFDQFVETMAPKPREVAVFTKTGKTPYWKLPFSERLFLIFGSETRGLPEKILSRYSDATYSIPITDQIRCLNLSTAVGIALYESLRYVLKAQQDSNSR
ncbi:MAG: tRNA (cytidine(34)-2'-O)-methyltransferase [Deltaproteobacteria bacterium]|nr:tRNA (cytidine(34)-2'-O)-methyltransferase [Deltaproteobacteria bacterium]